MSIADKITLLQNARNAIRTKLVEKGITDASSHGFSQFADDIANINISSDAVIILAEIKTGAASTTRASYKLQNIIKGVPNRGQYALIDSTMSTQYTTVFSLLNSALVPVVGGNLYGTEALGAIIGTIIDVKIL